VGQVLANDSESVELGADVGKKAQALSDAGRRNDGNSILYRLI
jgi:hypothetical protein